MEVLQKGKERKGGMKRKCTGAGNDGGGCGAVLRVSAADIYQTVSGYYDGSTDYYSTFCCPMCGIETDIDYYDGRQLGKRPSERERDRRARVYASASQPGVQTEGKANPEITFAINCRGRNDRMEKALQEPVEAKIRIFQSADATISTDVQCPYNTGAHGQRCRASHPPDINKVDDGVLCPYSVALPYAIEQSIKQKF